MTEHAITAVATRRQRILDRLSGVADLVFPPAIFAACCLIRTYKQYLDFFIKNHYFAPDWLQCEWMALELAQVLNWIDAHPEHFDSPEKQSAIIEIRNHLSAALAVLDRAKLQEAA